MASAGATEKEREFLRWKRRQDHLRAQQTEAKRMEQQHKQQQQRLASKKKEEAMVPRRQPARAYPATFLQQQQQNPPRKSTFYYDEDIEQGKAAYDAQRRRHSVCASVDSAAFADAEPSPSRTFDDDDDDDDDADTEEDELMRMIMEKERQEAEAEARASAAVKAAKATIRGKKEQRFQVPQRTTRSSAAVSMGEDFYSPVRPADSENGSAAHGHAPFRGVRVVTENHRYKQRSPVFGEQRQPQQQQQERPAKFVNFHPTNSDSDVTSNQIDHELPPFVEDRSSKTKREKEQRLQNEDDMWEHFMDMTSADDVSDDHHHGQKQSLDVRKNKKKHNLFREEISLSQSRSTSLDSGFPATNESINITTRHQEGQSQPSGNYLNESIPNVSYSPPMSPAASSSKNSSARWRQSSNSFDRSQQGAGGEERSPDGNRDGSDGSAGQQHHRFQTPSPVAIFPFWSVAFLISCVVVGVSGFFIEDVMDLVGKFTKTASTLSLSKEEQKQMHTRLEQLQSEIHGFRFTASEIEVHSQKVFAEVKAHLDRMKSEREKHQEMIAREMNDLRGYMLHMMSDMVEQERELIYTRLKRVTIEEEESKEKAAQKVEEGVVKRVDESKKDDVNNDSDKIREKSRQQPVEEKPEMPRSSRPPPVMDVSTVIEVENPPAVAVGEANATLRVEHIQPAAGAAALTRGEGVMLMSWELLMMLTAMSILGGLVGLRVRNMNRRKRWYEQRRIRRHIQAQLEQERAARILEEEEEEDDDDDSEEVEEEEEGDEGDEARTGNDNSEDWDDGATESSIETVSLMRRATGLTPNGKQRRAAASSEEEEEEEDGDDDSGGSEDDGIEAIGIRERKTAEQRYKFINEDGDMEQSPSRRRSSRLEERVPRH